MVPLPGKLRRPLRPSLRHLPHRICHPLDLELSRLSYSIRDPKNQKSPETLIHDAYMRMNMMLAS